MLFLINIYIIHSLHYQLYLSLLLNNTLLQDYIAITPLPPNFFTKISPFADILSIMYNVHSNINLKYLTISYTLHLQNLIELSHEVIHLSQYYFIEIYHQMHLSIPDQEPQHLQMFHYIYLYIFLSSLNL